MPHGEAGVVAIFMGLLHDGGDADDLRRRRARRRDYVYVGDVARALLRALEHDGGVFNVGTGAETSVLDLYDAIQRRDAASTARRRSRRRVSASSNAASSTSRSRRASSAGGRSSARRRPRRDVGLDRRSKEERTRPGETERAVDHAQHCPTPFPWRTATLVAGVARSSSSR